MSHRLYLDDAGSSQHTPGTSENPQPKLHIVVSSESSRSESGSEDEQGSDAEHSASSSGFSFPFLAAHDKSSDTDASAVSKATKSGGEEEDERSEAEESEVASDSAITLSQVDEDEDPPSATEEAEIIQSARKRFPNASRGVKLIKKMYGIVSRPSSGSGSGETSSRDASRERPRQKAAAEQTLASSSPERALPSQLLELDEDVEEEAELAKFEASKKQAKAEDDAMGARLRTLSLESLRLAEDADRVAGERMDDEEVMSTPRIGFMEDRSPLQTPRVGSSFSPKTRASPRTPRQRQRSNTGTQTPRQRRGSEQEEERADEADDEGELTDLPAAAVASVRQPTRRRRRPRRPRREVYIELSHDAEFLTLLTGALESLAALQLVQKSQFAASVDRLANEVASVSSPARPRNDLYAWREIFALWVEAAIFESDRERDRGERAVEDAESRLDWFAEQIARRKLAKRMRHRASREALESFVQLNVELLDLKRFQLANEQAVRKILKKHDKRTALTATQGFPAFVAAVSKFPGSTGGAGTDERRVLVLPGFPSLPHILLATLTTRLLPVLPSLDDYECAICGEIAFQPIRLACAHRFCVRCLIKMQKRAQDACPHCRAPVVLDASAENLDHAMVAYMRQWFPKEVRDKEQRMAIEQWQETDDPRVLSNHQGGCVVT